MNVTITPSLSASSNHREFHVIQKSNPPNYSEGVLLAIDKADELAHQILSDPRRDQPYINMRRAIGKGLRKYVESANFEYIHVTGGGVRTSIDWGFKDTNVQCALYNIADKAFGTALACYEPTLPAGGERLNKKILLYYEHTLNQLSDYGAQSYNYLPGSGPLTSIPPERISLPSRTGQGSDTNLPVDQESPLNIPQAAGFEGEVDDQPPQPLTKKRKLNKHGGLGQGTKNLEAMKQRYNYKKTNQPGSTHPGKQTGRESNSQKPNPLLGRTSSEATNANLDIVLPLLGSVFSDDTGAKSEKKDTTASSTAQKRPGESSNDCDRTKKKPRTQKIHPPIENVKAFIKNNSEAIIQTLHSSQPAQFSGALKLIDRLYNEYQTPEGINKINIAHRFLELSCEQLKIDTKHIKKGDLSRKHTPVQPEVGVPTQTSKYEPGPSNLTNITEDNIINKPRSRKPVDPNRGVKQPER